MVWIRDNNPTGNGDEELKGCSQLRGRRCRPGFYGEVKDGNYLNPGNDHVLGFNWPVFLERRWSGPKPLHASHYRLPTQIKPPVASVGAETCCHQQWLPGFGVSNCVRERQWAAFGSRPDYRR